MIKKPRIPDDEGADAFPGAERLKVLPLSSCREVCTTLLNLAHYSADTDFKPDMVVVMDHFFDEFGGGEPDFRLLAVCRAVEGEREATKLALCVPRSPIWDSLVEHEAFVHNLRLFFSCDRVSLF